MNQFVAGAVSYYEGSGSALAKAFHAAGREAKFPLQYHRAGGAVSKVRKRFVFLAGIYYGRYGHRVWTEDTNGKILFDTARGDYANKEVYRVRKAKVENLPLYIGQLKTQAGKNELERRMKK